MGAPTSRPSGRRRIRSGSPTRRISSCPTIRLAPTSKAAPRSASAWRFSHGDAIPTDACATTCRPPPMGAETARCSHCGGNASLAFVAKDLNRHLTEEAFPYYRCGSCGLVFMHPVPPELGRYYPSNYHDIPRSLEELLQRRRGESYKLEALARVSGKRLLEIGPSFGAFAALARQAGFDVQT